MIIYCCPSFEKALEWGTDFGEDGPLVRYADNEYTAGSDLPRLQYCPWCGLDLDD